MVAYNALMVVVLVYGAEHYVSDILLGWVYAATIYVVLSRILDRRTQPRDAARVTAASSTTS